MRVKRSLNSTGPPPLDLLAPLPPGVTSKGGSHPTFLQFTWRGCSSGSVGGWCSDVSAAAARGKVSPSPFLSFSPPVRPSSAVGRV